MERVIDPVVGDLQREYEQASRSPQPWSRHWVLLRGYCGFWQVVAFHLPMRWIGRLIGECATAGHGTVAAGFRGAAIAMITVTALLVAVPLHRFGSSSRQAAWLFVLLVPQSLPFTLPITLLAGVWCGLAGRSSVWRVRRAILVLGLAGSLVSAATQLWVTPPASHAFRASVAANGAGYVPGKAMGIHEARQWALLIREDGFRGQAGALLLEYHFHWALAGAALSFTLFGLGVAALRCRRRATTAIALAGCVAYVGYFFELQNVRLLVFSDERVAFAAAWLPNVVFILVSLASLNIRNRPVSTEASAG